MKDLSIIIPVYNSEKYIGECLNSIICEINEQKDELIIIDDGSTDCSLKIFKRYNSNNIKIINKQNEGVSDARNTGINNANGKFIMFVDADDKLKKGWRNKINQYLKSNIDLCFLSNEYLNTKNITKKDIINSMFFTKTESYIPYIPSVWSKLYKRDFLMQRSIQFNSKIINGEDLIFNLNSILYTDNIKLDCNSIYEYRININSSTRKFNEKIFESDNEFYNQLNNLILNWNESFEKEKIYNYSIKNNIYMLALRITYSKKIKNFYKYKDEFICYNNKITKNYDIGKFKNFIVYLVKHKFYILVYILLNIKDKFVKKNIKNFIDI